MPTVIGFFKIINGSKYTAHFEIDDITYAVGGDIAPSVPPFTCDKATLEYSNVSQLADVRNYHGNMGTGDFTVTFENGPKITGAIKPVIDVSFPVDGSGNWISS